MSPRFSLVITTLFFFIPFVNLFAQDPVLTTRQLIELDNMQGMKRPSFTLPARMPGTVNRNSFFPPGFISYPAPGNNKTLSSNCTDSSFTKTFATTLVNHSFHVTEKTGDGGILMGGFGRNVNLNPVPPYSSILCKFDSAGQHIWSRQLQSDVSFSFFIESIKELSD